jgi:hypothetical protein
MVRLCCAAGALVASHAKDESAPAAREGAATVIGPLELGTG